MAALVAAVGLVGMVDAADAQLPGSSVPADLPPEVLRLLPPEVRPPAAPARPDCAVVRCVALTFDDGPRRETTPRLLDILGARGVTATFFQVGREIGGNEDILRRQRDLGMELGNHSWSHTRFTTLSAAAVTDELRRTNEAITRATGTVPTHMRPPYGEWKPGVTPTEGMRPVLWDVDPLDWRDRDAAVVTRRVVDGARPGAVILLHDTHPTSVDAVPAILDGLAARGLVPVSVAELEGAARPPAPAPAPPPAPAVPGSAPIPIPQLPAFTLPELRLPEVALPPVPPA